MTDRRINVPRRDRKTRKVEGFDAVPGAPDSQPPESGAPPAQTGNRPAEPVLGSPPAPTKPRSKPRGKAAPKRERKRKLKVFVSISQDLGRPLPEYAKAHNLTHTETLLTALLQHSEELTSEYDRGEAEKWAALGLRQPARKRPVGRVQKQFYLTEQELELIDSGVVNAGYDSRSAYVDELLRRQLDLVTSTSGS